MKTLRANLRTGEKEIRKKEGTEDKERGGDRRREREGGRKRRR